MSDTRKSAAAPPTAAQNGAPKKAAKAVKDRAVKAIMVSPVFERSYRDSRGMLARKTGARRLCCGRVAYLCEGGSPTKFLRGARPHNFNGLRVPARATKLSAMRALASKSGYGKKAVATYQVAERDSLLTLVVGPHLRGDDGIQRSIICSSDGRRSQKYSRIFTLNLFSPTQCCTGGSVCIGPAW